MVYMFILLLFMEYITLRIPQMNTEEFQKRECVLMTSFVASVACLERTPHFTAQHRTSFA